MSASDGMGRTGWVRRFYVGEDRQEGGRRILSHPLSQLVGSLREAEAQRRALLHNHPQAHVVAVSSEVAQPRRRGILSARVAS